MKGGSTTAEQKGTVIPTLPGVNKCFICARTVYKMEEVIAAGQCWHLGCFNCGGNNTDGCNKRLRRDGYTVHNTQPYCPACSTKLSKLEGRNSPAAPGSENTMKISSVSPGGIQLVEAAKRGELALVTNLLARSADAWDVDKNYQDQGGGTALMWAAYNGHLEIVNALISAGCDAHKQNSQGCTALLCAAMTGYVEIVNALLQAGVDINAQSIQRETALMRAARAGHYEVVKALLLSGADALICNKNGDNAINLTQSKAIRDTLYIWADSGRLVSHTMPPVPPAPSPASYSGSHIKNTVNPKNTSSTINSTGTGVDTGTDGVGTGTNNSTGAGADRADSAIDSSGDNTAHYTALVSDVSHFLAQAAGVPARREWMQRRDALYAQYDEAKAADQFALCAKLGKSKLAVELESASLVLSVDDYKTLSTRREHWVGALISACKELAASESDFDALERLSQLLESLRALTEADLAFIAPDTNISTNMSSTNSNTDVKTVVIDDKR